MSFYFVSSSQLAAGWPNELVLEEVVGQANRPVEVERSTAYSETQGWRRRLDCSHTVAVCSNYQYVLLLGRREKGYLRSP